MTPGWELSQGSVGWNLTRRFEGYSSLLDANYANTTQPANPAKVPVVGNFSLGIWPHAVPDIFNGSLPFTLTQTGDIPADAQSLRFLYHGDNLTVFLGGVPATVHFLEDRPSGNPDVPLFHYYAVDVSTYAGQTTELRLDFRSFGNFPGIPSQPDWPDAKMHVLDDLSFSPLPAVPEPATWALLGTGMAVLLWFHRRSET